MRGSLKLTNWWVVLQIQSEMSAKILVLCPTNKLQKDCHSRAGGSPAQSRLDAALGLL